MFCLDPDSGFLSLSLPHKRGTLPVSRSHLGIQDVHAVLVSYLHALAAGNMVYVAAIGMVRAIKDHGVPLFTNGGH